MVIISKRHFRFHLIHCKADFPVVSCPPFYHLINFSVLSVRGNMTFLTSQNEINQMKGGESRVLIMYNLVSSCFWKSNLLLNIKSLLLVKFWLWKHVMNSFHYVTCGLRKLIRDKQFCSTLNQIFLLSADYHQVSLSGDTEWWSLPCCGIRYSRHVVSWSLSDGHLATPPGRGDNVNMNISHLPSGARSARYAR